MARRRPDFPSAPPGADLSHAAVFTVIARYLCAHDATARPMWGGAVHDGRGTSYCAQRPEEAAAERKIYEKLRAVAAEILARDAAEQNRSLTYVGIEALADVYARVGRGDIGADDERAALEQAVTVIPGGRQFLVDHGVEPFRLTAAEIHMTERREGPRVSKGGPMESAVERAGELLNTVSRRTLYLWRSGRPTSASPVSALPPVAGRRRPGVMGIIRYALRALSLIHI